MIFDEPPGSRAHFVEPEIDSRLEIEDHDLAVQLAERDVRIDRHHGGQRGPAHWHRSSHRIFHTHGVKSRERIAPSKMLPSGNRRAICDVTFCGPWGRGGLPREPGSEVGILESDLSALPASRAPGQAPDAD